MKSAVSAIQVLSLKHLFTYEKPAFLVSRRLSLNNTKIKHT